MKTQAKTPPNRETLTASWNAYVKLLEAGWLDDEVSCDPAYTAARDRAHARWSKAFVEWDGK